MATNPEKKTTAAYDAWVIEHNASLSDQEKPLLRASSFDRHYLLGWKRLVEVAEGKVSLAEAQEKKIAEMIALKKDTDLVGAVAIALFLGLTERATKHRIHLVPLEPIAADEHATFTVAPPWLKDVWRDPEAEGTG